MITRFIVISQSLSCISTTNCDYLLLFVNTGKVRSGRRSERGVAMFETIVFILAAFATIAQLLLEVWQLWKEYRSDDTRTDDDGRMRGSHR